MKNKFFILTLMFFLATLVPLVNAANPGHSAQAISPGTFAAGNYSFNGSVGIGTATPANTLNVVGDGNITGNLSVSGDGVTSGGLTVYGGGSTATLSAGKLVLGSNDLVLQNSNAGLHASLRDDNAGGLWLGWDTSGNMIMTGIYQTARNFTFDNTDKVLFLDAGNNRVGIGTATPDAQLDIVASSSPRLQFSQTTGDTAKWQMVINGNGDLDFTEAGVANRRLLLAEGGNVGIGGSLTPQELLHIEGDSNPAIQVGYAGNTNSHIYFGSNSANNFKLQNVNSASEFWITGTNGGAFTMAKAAPTDSLCIYAAENVFNDASNDVDFRVESDGNDNMLFVDGGHNSVGIGTSNPTDTLNVNGTMRVDNSIGSVTLSVNSSSENVGIRIPNPTEALDINGNVKLTGGVYSGTLGVGTTSPDRLLGINADFAPALSIETGDVAKVEFGLATSSNQWFTGTSANEAIIRAMSNDLWIGTYDSNKDLHFMTNNAERMIILYGGNVGINQTNPSYALDVAGNTKVTGDLNVRQVGSGGAYGLKVLNGSGSLKGNIYQTSGTYGGVLELSPAGAGSGTRITGGTANSYISSNFGIKTTDPTHELNVVGNANITGTLISGIITQSGTTLANTYVAKNESGSSYSARAYMSTAQSGLTKAAWNTIMYNSESYDVASKYSPGTADSNYTVPVTGKYHISAKCLIFSPLVGDYYIAIYDGSTEMSEVRYYLNTTNPPSYMSFQIADTLSLTANDIIRIKLYPNVAANTVGINEQTQWTSVAIDFIGV
jgi:hypothetical protein